MENKNWIPVKDYAIKHNMTVQNVYQLIKKGKLEGRKIGSYQLVLVVYK